MQKGRERNFGQSVGFHASAMLIEMLRRKAENCCRWSYRVCNDDYQTVPILPYLRRIPQKTLSQRVHTHRGLNIQRDVYSAFLALSVKDNALDVPSVNVAEKQLLLR